MSSTMRLAAVAALTVVAAACAVPRPFAIDDVSVARRLDARFTTVFGHGPEAGGLVSPRFGDPALVRPGGSFSLRLLEREGARRPAAALVDHATPVDLARSCLLDVRPAACVAVSLAARGSTPLGNGSSLEELVATPERALPRGCYDLVSGSGALVERAPRAVCVSEGDVAEPFVVQLSDVHLGRFGQAARILRRLRAILADVQRLHPDVVVVTGDMADQGHDLRREEQAAAELAVLEMPVVTVIGNHDYGHYPRHCHTDRPDYGYFNFARAFHGSLVEVHDVDGWRFLGFDSGPATSLLRVLTRGIGQDTLDLVGATLAEDASAARGTVLVSHASTRAAISSDPRAEGSNRIGSMAQGAHELEALLLGAAARHQRVVYLAGHTHWSDLFVARPATGHFERIPFHRLTAGVVLDSDVALVNAPSATRITFPTIEHGNAYGYVELRLRARETLVRFHLFDDDDRPRP